LVILYKNESPPTPFNVVFVVNTVFCAKIIRQTAAPILVSQAGTVQSVTGSFAVMDWHSNNLQQFATLSNILQH
jgi:hypothetical protein